MRHSPALPGVLALALLAAACSRGQTAGEDAVRDQGAPPATAGMPDSTPPSHGGPAAAPSEPNTSPSAATTSSASSPAGQRSDSTTGADDATIDR